ncbi:hypothetical protein E8E14_003422 [Neopestalotiopsis sp. 37M]|nr:hypothetical protein E8E14_003422 [Neopestalotiopsis sp. 37M]
MDPSSTPTNSIKPKIIGGERTWINPAGITYEENRWTTDRALMIEFFVILSVILAVLVIGCCCSLCIMDCFRSEKTVGDKEAKRVKEQQEKQDAKYDADIAEIKEKKEAGVREKKFM